jgi:hypothetical protein
VWSLDDFQQLHLHCYLVVFDQRSISAFAHRTFAHRKSDSGTRNFVDLSFEEHLPPDMASRHNNGNQSDDGMEDVGAYEYESEPEDIDVGERAQTPPLPSIRITSE